MIVEFSDNGPMFHVVHQIIFDKKFLFITKRLSDFIYDKHLHEYKLFDLNKFIWKRLDEEEVDNCYVTNTVILSNGFHYISKNWL